MAQLDLSNVPDNELLHISFWDQELNAIIGIYAHKCDQVFYTDVVIINPSTREKLYFIAEGAGIVDPEIHAPKGKMVLPERLTIVLIHSTGEEAANDLAKSLLKYEMGVDETEALVSRLGDSVQQSEQLIATLEEKSSHASNCWIKELEG